MEDALIRKAQGGDREAFAALVDQSYGQLFSYALKYCGHRQDAEDVTQQACIRLARSLGSFRFEAAFNTWLYRLVINCARDWYRQQGSHLKSSEEFEIADGSEGEGETLVYLREVLNKVEKLGDDFRETLALVAGEGFSHREAGEMLGIKESTVSWRIHQIRQYLADSAEDGGRQ